MNDTTQQADGYREHIVIVDDISHHDRDVIDQFRTSQGTRSKPLVIRIEPDFSWRFRQLLQGCE